MMKLIFTGDIHYPVTTRKKLDVLIKSISEEKPNVVVLGGDLAESYYNVDFFDFVVRSFVQKLNKIPILVLVGNHDLYVDVHSKFKYNSYQLWKTELKHRTRKEGAVWLESRIWSLRSTAVIGSYLHYDYSAAEPSLMLPDDFYKTNKHRIIRDGNSHVLLPEDKIFSKEIGNKFISRIKRAQNNKRINKIVLVSHVPILEEQITRKPDDLNWSLANAYFGSLTYRNFILNSSKVVYALSAHSHVYKSAIIERNNMNSINVFSLGADYGYPDYVAVEV